MVTLVTNMCGLGAVLGFGCQRATARCDRGGRFTGFLLVTLLPCAQAGTVLGFVRLLEETYFIMSGCFAGRCSG